jgi:hypothetical protein
VFVFWRGYRVFLIAVVDEVVSVLFRLALLHLGFKPAKPPGSENPSLQPCAQVVVIPNLWWLTFC